MNEVSVSKGERGIAATRDDTCSLVPPVDIFEHESGLAVLADLPGVDRDGVSVGVDNDLLTIKGNVSYEPKGELIHREWDLASCYFRQFRLSERIDQEKISAEMRDGVLTVRLPESEQAKPKRIEVKTS